MGEMGSVSPSTSGIACIITFIGLSPGMSEIQIVDIDLINEDGVPIEGSSNIIIDVLDVISSN